MNINIKVGTLGFIQLLFLVLKLTLVIDWAWWVVLLPAMIYIAFYLMALFVVKSVLKAKQEEIAKQLEKKGPSKWALKLEEMQKMQKERLTVNRNSISDIGEAMHDMSFRKNKTDNWPN